MMPRGLVIALQFLTRVPTPQLSGFEPADLAKSSAYFPLVGLLIGGLVASAVWAGALISPWVGALAGLVVWIGVTGGVHLDGLGDIADALGASHRSPEKFHAVLADPHAGSFAVIAIALQIAAKLVLLASLPVGVAIGGLVLIPAWARWGTLVWSSLLPTLKPGLGQSFSSAKRSPLIAVWAAGLVAASLWFAPILVSAVVVVTLCAAYWRWRLGGITGDCLGASIEVTESLLLLALVIGAAIGKPLLG